MFLLNFLAFKWIIGFVVVGVVVVGAGGTYLAAVGGVDIPVVSDALRVDPEPPSPEVIARAEQVEQDIRDAIEDNSAFFVELTDQNLTDLLQSELSTDDRIHNLDVEIREDDVKVKGELAGRVGVGFSGVIGINLNLGQVELELKSVNLSAIPTPGFVKDEIQPFIDEVLDINERLRESGATQVQAINIDPGVIQIVGVQSGGETVGDNLIASLRDSVPSPGSPTPPGAGTVPQGRTGSEEGSPLYLALGDSLAANVGVNDPTLGYVSRFHAYLEGERSETLGLRNLGISGESTISIVGSGQLQQALNILNGTQQVAALTIDLGTNDVLSHIGSDDCIQGESGPRGAACQARVQAAMEAFGPNFRQILSQISSAMDPGTEFYVMTVYNPFDFGIGLPLEDYSSQIVADLNAIIATEGAAAGAQIADPFPLMADNAGAWTNMLTASDIHPNADGFQVLAFSLAEAREN